VNKIIPETEMEKTLFDNRMELQQARRGKKAVKAAPTCADILTPLVERGCAVADMPALANPNTVLMAFTKLENVSDVYTMYYFSISVLHWVKSGKLNSVVLCELCVCK
jgi:hypothetical protein